MSGPFIRQCCRIASANTGTKQNGAPGEAGTPSYKVHPSIGRNGGHILCNAGSSGRRDTAALHIHLRPNGRTGPQGIRIYLTISAASFDRRRKSARLMPKSARSREVMVHSSLNVWRYALRLRDLSAIASKNAAMRLGCVDTATLVSVKYVIFILSYRLRLVLSSN